MGDPVRSSTVTTTIAMLLLLSATTAMGDGQVPVVHSDQPRDGVVDVDLEPLWRAGLDDDVLFGLITRVVESANGDVYVLDGQLDQIQVFAHDGKRLRSIGREGEAPGEFMRANDLFFVGEDTVAVVQRNPPKVALMTPDGTPLDDLPLPDPNQGLRILSRGLDRGDAAVLASSGMFMANGKMETQARVFAVDRAGHEIAQYFDDRHAVDLASETFKEEDMSGIGGAWALTTTGELVVAPERDAYRLNVLDRDGDLLRVVERPFTPHVRTAEERKVISDNYSMDINGRKITVVVCPTDQVVDGVHPVPGGGFRTLLVEREEGDPDDFVARLDVFDREGHWIEQLRLHGDADVHYDRLFFENDRLYVARNAHDFTSEDVDDARPDDEPLHLVCCEMVRRTD